MTTFFGKTQHKFDADLSGGVKLIPFLNACRSYVDFYDLFGGTVFAPIKSDVSGNVNKLQTWYDKNPSCDTVEKLLQVEIDAGTTAKGGSATDALLWLKRGLWMMAKFMQSMLNGERDAGKSFNAAYAVALKPHHGWIVQQAFYVGLKMIPDFNGFLDSMTGAGFDGDKEKAVMEEMAPYIGAMNDILAHIDDFYTANKLKHP